MNDPFDVAINLLKECLEKVEKQINYIVDYETNKIKLDDEPCLHDRIKIFLSENAPK